MNISKESFLNPEGKIIKFLKWKNEEAIKYVQSSRLKGGGKGNSVKSLFVIGYSRIAEKIKGYKK